MKIAKLVISTMFIFTLCCVQPLTAQMKMQVAKPRIKLPSGKGQKTIDEARALAQKFKTIKKERIDQINRQIATCEQYKDSIQAISKNADSLSFDENDNIHHHIDSLKKLKKSIPWRQLKDEYIRMFSSRMEAKLSEKAAAYGLPSQPPSPSNEFTSLIEEMSGSRTPVTGLHGEVPGAIPKSTQKLITEQMNEASQLKYNHFSQKEQQLQEAHKSLRKMRRKYIKVENTKTMKGAKKASSLKGTPLRKRLYTGGNVMIIPGLITMADCSPQIGFRINKRWDAGIQGKMRMLLQREAPYISRDDQQVAGYTLFSEYKFIKNFFLHSSWERLNRIPRKVPGVHETSGSEWVDNAFIGLGKQYRINDFIKGTFTFKYNFFHQISATYPRAWVVDFGFQVKTVGKGKETLVRVFCYWLVLLYEAIII